MKTDFKIILLQATLLIGLPLFAQQNNKAEAQTGVCQTKTDSASYEIFKKEAEKQINENQQKIALLKAKELSSSMRVNKKFNKKILALEIKNNKLRKRIGECVNIKHECEAVTIINTQNFHTVLTIILVQWMKNLSHRLTTHQWHHQCLHRVHDHP